MSDNLLTTVTSDSEIPCMLLPMLDHTLLVPTTSVAEMSSVKPLETAEDSPEWVMGYYDWRGMKVPVVALETLNGGAPMELNMQGRIAVLNNTGVNPNLKFIAIHTQGIPRMARIAEDDITEHLEADKRPFDIMPVKVGLEEFSIPDVSAIEMAYANVVQPN